jgi:hypothetical protein
MKKTTWLIIGFILIYASSTAQKPDSFAKTNLEREISLKNDSKTEEITITIEQGTKLFELMINSSIKSGKLTIEIFDPSGTKQGNFSVETQLGSDKNEQVVGNFHKSLKEPQSGNWRIKIIPVMANGLLSIRTVFLQ